MLSCDAGGACAKWRWWVGWRPELPSRAGVVPVLSGEGGGAGGCACVKWRSWWWFRAEAVPVLNGDGGGAGGNACAKLRWRWGWRPVLNCDGAGACAKRRRADRYNDIGNLTQ